MALSGSVGPAAAAPPAWTAATTPTRTMQIGDARIAHRTFGDGPPLVLLQRFRATMDDWDPALLEALSRQHRLILLDYTGAGASTGSARTTIDALAGDVADFLSALEVGPADVLGWSLGGMVAQRLALDHPETVRRLVLASTHPGGGPGTAGPSPTSSSSSSSLAFARKKSSSRCSFRIPRKEKP